MSNPEPSQAAQLLFAQFTLILLLLLTASFAFVFQDEKALLDCLDERSHSQHPTSQVTYTQQNSSFQSVLQAYARNKRFQQPHIRKPLVIVTPKHVSNVRATSLCCKACGLQMRIRAGGHDMEGISYMSSVPFVILDMFNMRSININIEDETALVQAGATLGEVYYNIAEKSPVHAFPGGVCPTVGVAGYFSEGGYGNLMRKYGLATDNVIDALLMDVNDNVLNRTTMGSDLFWAILGGGAASFGVILEWKIKLVHIPPIVTVFRVTQALEHGASYTVYRWQEVAPNLPKELFIRVRFSVVRNRYQDNNNLHILFIGMFLGQTNELVDLLVKSFPELGLSTTDCIEMPWVNSTLFWYDIPIGSPTELLLSREYESVSRKVKSDFVMEPISQAGLGCLWTELLDMDGLVMEWNPYGGRMNEISPDEIAYPYRAGHLFLIEYDFQWYEEGIEVDQYHIELSRRLYEFMTPFVSKYPRKAFFNYRDLDLGTNSGIDAISALSFGTKYYGANFPMLVKVKSEVDPLNFFRNEQSIPPINLL